jgi:hypothetical protein
VPGGSLQDATMNLRLSIPESQPLFGLHNHLSVRSGTIHTYKLIPTPFPFSLLIDRSDPFAAASLVCHFHSLAFSRSTPAIYFIIFLILSTKSQTTPVTESL